MTTDEIRSIKDTLKEITAQNAELFKISSKLNGHYVDLENRTKKHENYHVILDEKLDRIIAFQERSEPMVKIFEDNKIVKMKFDGWFKTMTFYTTEGSKIAVFILGTWSMILWLIRHNPFK